MTKTRLWLLAILILLCGAFFFCYRLGRGSNSGSIVTRNRIPPRLYLRTEPQYSDEALSARINANVELSGSVTPSGIISDIKIIHGPGFGLEEKAAEAVKAWRFHPATEGDRKLTVRASVMVPFHLPDVNVPIASLRFDTPKGTARPVLVAGSTADLPIPKGNSQVAFEVNDRGMVDNVSGSTLEMSRMLRTWHFRPATLNDLPVSARAVLNLRRVY